MRTSTIVAVILLAIGSQACKTDTKKRDRIKTVTSSTDPASDSQPTATNPPPTATQSSTSFVGQALDITNTRVSYFALNLPLPTPTPTDSYYYSTVPTKVMTQQGEIEEDRKYVIERGKPMLNMRLAPASTEKKPIPSEIFVLSPRFRNSNGTHVGSTLAEIQATGVPFSIWYSYTTDMFVLEFQGHKPQYILEPVGFAGTKPSSSDRVAVAAHELSPDTKVKEIRLH